jgi:SAM-dependent methyltransferase
MRDPPRRLVRSGYDLISTRYLAARPVDGEDVELLGELVADLAPGALVLDAGAGAGVPVAARLAGGGLRVVALDFSTAQVALGRLLVPAATFVQADLTSVPIAKASVAAVVSYYAIIHIPRSDHARVFSEFHRVLQPGGLVLLCLGADDVPSDHDPDSWLGVPMFWSHFDGPTNLALLSEAGFEIVWHRPVEDPMHHGRHLFVLARRP